MRAIRRTLPLAVLAGCLLSLAGCRSEIVVRLTTRVFHDGSISRHLAISGRTAEREVPKDESWLHETAGVVLADPDAWSRVSRGPGTLEAESFTAAGLPIDPPLAFRLGESIRPARDLNSIEVDRRGVLTRWRYSATQADPIGPEETEAALERMIELASGVARDELTRWLGAEIDPEPAVAALRTAARTIGRELLAAEPPSDVTDDAADDEDPFITISRRLRDEVAVGLRRAGSTIEADELDFWPLTPDGAAWNELVARHWGDEEGLLDELEPMLAGLDGYFSGQQSPRFRFELRLELPGTLLQTNGTPDGAAALWIVRNDDLVVTRQAELRASSVEADLERLVALGARRDLDIESLVRLEELLWRRDPQGVLGRLLDHATVEGGLTLLIEADGDEIDGMNEPLAILAQELGELLSPAPRR